MQVTSLTRKAAILLTAMASGRAMTLAFISRAGDGGVGDPPDAWLMPLIGDAFVGVAAVGVAWVLWKRPTPLSWIVAVAWSAVAAFDAIGAYLVDLAAPWPEFFMLDLFGRSMFFAAAGLHIAIIVLLSRPVVRNYYGIDLSAPPAHAAA